jgi:hypothetical protein
MNVPMNIGYLIYEAERPKSIAEQRAADARKGEFAAGVARVTRSVKEAVVRAADLRRTGGPAAGTAAEAEAVARGGDLSVADLERLYASPCGHRPVDSHGADGERTVRSS